MGGPDKGTGDDEPNIWDCPRDWIIRRIPGNLSPTQFYAKSGGTECSHSSCLLFLLPSP